MAYVSLYRKWRPQTFADIVGQDHVTGTLVNAIRTGQVHHAMLFTGTRGTGKTSTARVLAKALNCERGPTPEPDNTCEQCRSITDGTNLDVVEIDAASHGSVDDARDLREKASYAPAAARNKVYIVDEAHMVTTQGFNAMLKVLEEPPEHVRFVFCTTEPHKVIEAIRSRCQRHDFRRIRTAALVADFARICEAEGVDIEPAALELVARAADGSHRDGLSRLDQVLTYAGPKVTLADVAQVLGALPAELRFDLAEALAAHRVADVLACVERVVDAGHDLQQFAREALEHLRDLYVLRVAPESTTLVDVTSETRERLGAQAGRFGPGELGRLVRVVGETYMDLRTATDQRLVLEVGLAKAALPEASLDADALLARIERLERRLSIATADAPLPTPPAARAAPAAAGEEPGAATPPRSTATARPGAAARTAAEGTPAARGATGKAGPAAGGAAGKAAATTGGAAGKADPAAGGAAGEADPAAGGPAGSAASAAHAAEGAAARTGGGAAAARTAPAARAQAAAKGTAAGRGAAGKGATASVADEEPGWAADEAAASVPVDLDLVRRSWPLVVERVQAASRVTASFLGNGRPVALEGRQVVVELPRDKRFEAEALSKDGRNRQVNDVLEVVLGGGLEIRVVVGDRPAAAEPAEQPGGQGGPAEPPPVAEFEVDPANDEGRPLDADADARAVADWAARELGGQVIEERPNQGAGRRDAGSRARGRPRRSGS
jgi:DNA polymerase III subunit gamma/tau